MSYHRWIVSTCPQEPGRLLSFWCIRKNISPWTKNRQAELIPITICQKKSGALSVYKMHSPDYWQAVSVPITICQKKSGISSVYEMCGPIRMIALPLMYQRKGVSLEPNRQIKSIPITICQKKSGASSVYEMRNPIRAAALPLIYQEKSVSPWTKPADRINADNDMSEKIRYFVCIWNAQSGLLTSCISADNDMSEKIGRFICIWNAQSGQGDCPPPDVSGEEHFTWTKPADWIDADNDMSEKIGHFVCIWIIRL